MRTKNHKNVQTSAPQTITIYQISFYIDLDFITKATRFKVDWKKFWVV